MSEFINNHEITFFFIVCCALHYLTSIINRVIRSINIRSKGWPPSHLDADGDWKPEKDNNNG